MAFVGPATFFFLLFFFAPASGAAAGPDIYLLRYSALETAAIRNQLKLATKMTATTICVMLLLHIKIHAHARIYIVYRWVTHCTTQMPQLLWATDTVETLQYWEWISRWLPRLRNRSQQVDIDETPSRKAIVTSGLPQGARSSDRGPAFT